MAKCVETITAYENITDSCGIVAARIWALINELESTKRSGPDGAIVFDIVFLARRLDASEDDVASAAFNLIRKKLARPANNGAAIKAA